MQHENRPVWSKGAGPASQQRQLQQQIHPQATIVSLQQLDQLQKAFSAQGHAYVRVGTHKAEMGVGVPPNTSSSLTSSGPAQW